MAINAALHQDFDWSCQNAMPTWEAAFGTGQQQTPKTMHVHCKQGRVLILLHTTHLLPIRHAPAFQPQDGFHHEDDRQAVAHRLIDHTRQLKKLRSARAAVCVLPQRRQEAGAEQRGSVAVGFEVNTNVELLGFVVQVLHT